MQSVQLIIFFRVHSYVAQRRNTANLSMKNQGDLKSRCKGNLYFIGQQGISNISPVAGDPVDLVYEGCYSVQMTTLLFSGS